MFRNVIFAGLVAFAPVAATAQEMVYAEDPEVIAALLEEMGFPAEITTDNVGDPMIMSSAHGYDFDIFFYDCLDNAECQAIQFSSAFDMVDGMSLTSAQDFNRNKRWGKVYLDDESDPRLEMDYNLRGGVSVDNFNDTVDWWQIVMEEFIDYINF